MQQTKSPPSRLPLLKERTIWSDKKIIHHRIYCFWSIWVHFMPPVTCPCMFMITTVLLLLQTMNCSGFLGNSVIVWMVRSPPAFPPNDLYVEIHSFVFMLHTLRWRGQLKIGVMGIICYSSAKKIYSSQDKELLAESTDKVHWIHFSEVFLILFVLIPSSSFSRRLHA